MEDGQQRDRTGRRLWGKRRLGLDRLQLAARRGVDGVPASGTEPLAKCIGSLEIAGSTALDALIEEVLRLGSIRSFWL